MPLKKSEDLMLLGNPIPPSDVHIYSQHTVHQVLPCSSCMCTNTYMYIPSVIYYIVYVHIKWLTG